VAHRPAFAVVQALFQPDAFHLGREFSDDIRGVIGAAIIDDDYLPREWLARKVVC
jgi:hypothetical protein